MITKNKTKLKVISSRNSKGITLIALVVTIIVLIILAGVSLYLILGENGLIEKAKGTKPIVDVASAQEKLELVKGPVQLEKYGVNLDDYLEELEKVKEKYEVDDVERIDNDNAEIIIGGKYKFIATDEKNGNVKITYQGEVGGLEISPTSGTYIYPTTGTFEVIKNISGGELSVRSENENIAKASISGTIVTVVPQDMAGTTKIVVTSAAKGEYAQGKAIYTAIVENGTISLEADAYEGNYDGKDHDAVSNVKVTPSDATLEYSLNGGEFSTTIPKVNEATTYSVVVRATKAGYATETLTKIVSIKKITTEGLEAGAYIKYDTGVSSIGTNGVVTCRVLYNASSQYGLQIITDKNITNVTLGGSDWATASASYNNAIQTLNTEAEKYLNTEYATDVRCVGSVPTNQSGTFTNKNSENAGPVKIQFTTSASGTDNLKGTDSNYKTDQTQMQKLNIWTTGENYWLASRNVLSSSSRYGFYMRYAGTDGTLSSSNLCYVRSNDSTNGYSCTNGLRPCFALKSDIIITGGNGTSDTPYTM